MRTALQQSFWDRLAGVITLQRPTYDALQHDPDATGQAWLIVLFLGIANGIALIATPLVTVVPGMPQEMADDVAAVAAAFTFDTTGERVMALVAGVVSAVLSWYISSWLLRAIGNRMAALPGQGISTEQMRRLVAWGYSPSLAAFLLPIPVVGSVLATVGSLWAFVTGVMAVRSAFNTGIGKAIAIEVVAFLVVFVVLTAIIVITVMIAIPFT